MAIKKVKLPNNSTVDINDARLPDVTSSDNGNILAVSSGAWAKSGLKTVNNNSLLGTGNIDISGGGSGPFAADEDYNGSAYNVALAGEVLGDGAVCLHGGSAEGECSTSMGDGYALGNYSVAEGESESGGNYAHSEGNGTVASGNYSHAEGRYTKANAGASHVEGAYTYTNQQTAHAEGYNTVANGEGSHAEGGSQVYSFPCTASANSTTITGSFAQSNIAPFTSTQFANVIKAGYVYHESNTSYRVKITDFTLTSSGSNYNYTMTTEKALSTSALSGNIKVVWQYAYGNYSHSEGGGTVAYGLRSHAEGYATYAFGDYSHTEGQQTYTSNTAEHACGLYNKSTSTSSKKTQFSIGVGSSSARKNAIEVDTTGKVYVKDVGAYDGTNITSSSVKDLATTLGDYLPLSGGTMTGDIKMTDGEYITDTSGNTIIGHYVNNNNGMVYVGDSQNDATINFGASGDLIHDTGGSYETILDTGNYSSYAIPLATAKTVSAIHTFSSGLKLPTGTSWTSSDRALYFSASGDDTNLRYYYTDSNKGLTYNPNTGALKSGSFVKRGGTSSQYLRADGSVGTITISSSDPTSSTGSDGDIWIKI